MRRCRMGHYNFTFSSLEPHQPGLVRMEVWGCENMFKALPVANSKRRKMAFGDTRPHSLPPLIASPDQ